MSIEVFREIPAWRRFRKGLAGSLGFVPTMGALHEGHLSLVRKSLKENDRTLVSIFVNPAQFNDPKDLRSYPRSFESDLEKLRLVGADYVISPDADSMYADQFRYQVVETKLSKDLCGVDRPGHFDGVLTVVMKLLQLARADRAYFGEKDYQQLVLVRGMAEAFFLDTEIVGVKTVRDSRGLALSSRNELLNADEYETAVQFHEVLQGSKTAESASEGLQNRGMDVDYVEDRWGRRFGAVRVGKVRLIDNVRCET